MSSNKSGASGVVDFLIQKIQTAGAIPFVEFMQHALYMPQYGYYQNATAKFGAHGDFITAPELTALFGRTLAHQCREIFAALDAPIIFEFGAGSGKLCIDILRELDNSASLPSAYHILEVSGHLRQLQFENIKREIPHLLARVRWLSSWPTEPFCGVVIANEVLDAMPVRRFRKTSAGLFESYITTTPQQQFIECFKPCNDALLQAHVAEILHHTVVPYLSEANLFVAGWLSECYAMLEQGAVIIIDYGFPAHTYYHPDRAMGTLMCHYQHKAHPDPLLHVGEQDITAHVDFTHVAEAAHAAGFFVAGFVNQASFLLANGVLDLLTEIKDERALLAAQSAVKLLLQPGEMGELFKVMCLTKQLDIPLRGFGLYDKRASL